MKINERVDIKVIFHSTFHVFFHSSSCRRSVIMFIYYL